MEDPRLHRRIHAALTARLDSGEYPPGTRLNIGLLADEFDTTRTTVGKAVKLLAREGRIEFYAGLGWYVAEPPLSGQRMTEAPRPKDPVADLPQGNLRRAKVTRLVRGRAPASG